MPRGGARKELLVLTGEKPEVNREVAARLEEYGHADFVSYVAWACERALERGLLPHTNVGICTREELSRLRAVTASQGLMLESINPDLTVHAGSPTKHPERRLETIRHAGELRIPFTSGILVGIGERPEERLAALAALAELQHEYGHLRRSSSRTSSRTRATTARSRRRSPTRPSARAAGASRRSRRRSALGSGGDARRHAGAGP